MTDTTRNYELLRTSIFNTRVFKAGFSTDNFTYVLHSTYKMIMQILEYYVCAMTLMSQHFKHCMKCTLYVVEQQHYLLVHQFFQMLTV